MPVVGGETLTIIVGEQRPYQGVGSDGCGAGGGGGSFVMRSPNTPLVVAGGGGAASAYGSNARNGLNASLTSNGVSSGTLAGGTGGNGGGAISWEGGGGAGYLGNGANADVAQGGKAFLSGSTGGAGDSSESCNVNSGGYGGGGGGGNDFGGGGGGYSGGAADNPGNGAGGGGSYSIAAAEITVRATHGHGQVIIRWEEPSDITCVCDSVYDVGDRVRATVANPQASTGITLGHLGTVITGKGTGQSRFTVRP